MSTATIFNIQLILGYVPWLLFFGTYVWPRLKAMDRVDVQRAIAILRSFRFFGLVFLVPGVVGPNLPADFAANSPRTATSQPVYWPCSRSSVRGCVRSSGSLSSPST
jgi:hypothetical protein